jgi:hypothetical protein
MLDSNLPEKQIRCKNTSRNIKKRQMGILVSANLVSAVKV